MFVGQYKISRRSDAAKSLYIKYITTGLLANVVALSMNLVVTFRAAHKWACEILSPLNLLLTITPLYLHTSSILISYII